MGFHVKSCSLLISRFACLLLVILATGAVHAASVERVQPVPSRETPVEAADLGGGHWFVDFGKTAFGNIEIRDPELRMAATVTVHLGEARAGEHAVERRPKGTVRYQSHTLTLEPGVPASPKLDWRAPGGATDGWIPVADGMPEVMPFRYVEIEGAPETFSGDDILRVSWAVPFDDAASDFETSDAHLVSVWNLCKHTIKATSFLGLYVDGDRERKPYEADAIINQLSHYAVDAHYETGRRTLEYLLEHPTWPTEWRLQTVIIAWNDFLWSGDDTSLRAHFPALEQHAMIERRTADGLFLGFLDGDIRDIVDWPPGERDAYDMAMPVKSAVTAFHYRALVLLEKIAAHLGRAEDARRFAEMAAETFDAFNRKLWDEERGCYVDGLDPESEKRSRHASAHANFFPLALGLVPHERKARVAEFLKEKGMACSVYGAQFLLEALYEADEDGAAREFMTSDALRSWRNMEKVGSTVTLEAWDPSLKPNLDWNHAWGAAPANLISRKLMGIEPVEPGFRCVSIRPQIGGLDRANIKAPTPRGPIHLSIDRREEKWIAELVLPEGVEVAFLFPNPGPFTVDGEGASRVIGEVDGRPEVVLQGGRWTLTQP